MSAENVNAKKTVKFIEEKDFMVTNLGMQDRIIIDHTNGKITNKEIFSLIFIYASNNLLYATGQSSHKILFIDSENPSVLYLSSEKVNNLKKSFEEIFGKDLFECEDCHYQCERRSYNQKRCHNCSVKNRKKNVLKNVRRYREKNNNIV